MLIDPYGRPITYLRISVTDRCNLRCAYCMPSSGVGWLPKEAVLSADDIVNVAQAAASLGVFKIRLTGGEPLVRPDILEIVQKIAVLPGVEDLSMTTNATLLDKMARPLADAGLKRVNISLDTLNPEKYAKVTRTGDFSSAWKGILAAESAGLQPIKLNAVVIGGFNDDEIPALASLSIDHTWDMRFIELMPMTRTQDWGLDWSDSKQRFFPENRILEKLKEFHLELITQVESSSPERTYKIQGGKGTLGFISPFGNKFCRRCNRLRLTADGKLRACLLADHEIPIREALRSAEDLVEIIKKAVSKKPEGHQLKEYNCPDIKCMSQIGG